MLAVLKIPFGKHKESGLYFDAGSVPNGRSCNCICSECESDLEAVHPKNSKRQKYFRHVVNRKCTGGLETLFHEVAKQILYESNSVHLSKYKSFSYSSCILETGRYGCKPDAFLSGEEGTLIVEIYYSHRIDPKTLEIYLNKEERVLEIDISQIRKQIFQYDFFKDLILKTAERTLYPHVPDPPKEPEDSPGIWEFLLLVIFSLGAFLIFRGKNKFRR